MRRLTYDLSASQFSPEGKVFQIEYAAKAVENSGTAIAIKGKDAVVFAVENIVTSKLYEPGCNKRIYNIERHIGMCVAGLLADANHLAEVAREECGNYRSSYGEPIPLFHLADRLSMYMHAHTLYSAVRPFGCSVLLGAIDDSGTELEKTGLFVVEPSGISFAYNGCAIGKARQNAKTEIEKLKLEELDAKQAVKEAAKIIYLVHDEIKDKSFELQLSWVGKASGGRHQLVPKDLFDEAEAYAKQALEEADESDDEL